MSTTMTIRLEPEIRERLDQDARAARRSGCGANQDRSDLDPGDSCRAWTVSGRAKATNGAGLHVYSAARKVCP